MVVPDSAPSEHSAPDGSRLMNPIDMTLQIPPGVSSEHRNSIGNDSAFNEYHRVVRVVLGGSKFSQVVRAGLTRFARRRATSPLFIRSGSIDCPDHLGPFIRTAYTYGGALCVEPTQRTGTHDSQATPPLLGCSDGFSRLQDV